MLLQVVTEVTHLAPLLPREAVLTDTISDLSGQGGVLPVRTSVLSKMLLLPVLAMEILLDRFSSTSTALSGMISLSTMVFFFSPSTFLSVSPGI